MSRRAITFDGIPSPQAPAASRVRDLAAGYERFGRTCCFGCAGTGVSDECEPCWHCGGTGQKIPTIKCQTCYGTGVALTTTTTGCFGEGAHMHVDRVRCPQCDGVGEICQLCANAGIDRRGGRCDCQRR